MNAPPSNRIFVTTNPTFWEFYVASLVSVRYRWQFMIFYTVFPLVGLSILVVPFTRGERPAVVEILLALLIFAYLPLVTALTVWLRRRNKLAQGPFTCSFDAEGMHSSGPAFSQTIRWTAIARIRRSRKFLFIFIAPGRAHFIPLRAIGDPGFIDDLRSIAAKRTDFRV